MLPAFKKILYATDIGPGAPYVFRYALSLAHQYQGKIEVLHAMEPLSTFGQSLVELHISHNQSEEMHKAAREKARARLNERIDRLIEGEISSMPEGRALIGNIEVIEGFPAPTILAQAKKLQVDAIVIGTHRHTALGEALLGSTARKVLHGSAIPVLLTRIPDGFSEVGY
jgi:nucleotide-binding universal stress UspA family protein